MNKNLKKYKQGIKAAKEYDQLLLTCIPFVIAIFGAIFFVDAGSFKICIFIFINFILLGFYIITQERVNSINTDNKYLDEDIIKLRDICYDFENLKNSVKTSQEKIIQFTPFMAALDYTVSGVSSLLNLEQCTYEVFKEKIKNIIYNINKVIYHFYKTYQEHLTIALYYYNDVTAEFYDYISYSARADAEEKDKGRIWNAVDDAHICYVARHRETKEFIFNNINTDLPKPKNSKPSDANIYVSSISIPIFYKNSDRIMAVLSLTSNLPNRFDKSHPTNIIDNNINTIFVRSFYSIAKLIELAFNTIQPNKRDILIDILQSYNKINKLNDDQKKLLLELENANH